MDVCKAFVLFIYCVGFNFVGSEGKLVFAIKLATYGAAVVVVKGVPERSVCGTLYDDPKQEVPGKGSFA
jgi:hypothetical protein